MEFKKEPAPGDKDYKGGIFVTEVHDSSRHIHQQVTTYKDAKGNVTAVYIRDLFGGIL